MNPTPRKSIEFAPTLPACKALLWRLNGQEDAIRSGTVLRPRTGIWVLEGQGLRWGPWTAGTGTRLHN